MLNGLFLNDFWVLTQEGGLAQRCREAGHGDADLQLGSSDGVMEVIHAIRARRGQHHPLVMPVVAAARP